MKKTLLLFVVLFALLFSTTAVTANGPTVYRVNPASDNQKKFDKVTLVVDGDNYKVTVEDKVISDGVDGYHITIDPKKRTYNATKLEKEKLEKFQEEAIANIENTDPSLSITQAVSEETEKATDATKTTITPLATKTKWIQVKAVTDDPIGADLAWTTHKLTWNYTGSAASKNSRSGSCTAANPSSLGTHWYNTRCEYTTYSVIDGSRTVASDLESSYYNYDFGDNSKRTDVTHDVYIEGYYDGSSYYSATWTKSGEGSGLLDLDVYVTKG